MYVLYKVYMNAKKNVLVCTKIKVQAYIQITAPNRRHLKASLRKNTILGHCSRFVTFCSKLRCWSRLWEGMEDSRCCFSIKKENRQKLVCTIL